MQTVIIVIHLMVVLTMIGVVLLQRSEGGGLGTGSPAGFLSSRGTANVLTRTTALLALAFFATSLLLSALAGMDRKPRSILQGQTPSSQPAQGGPEAPVVPGGGGLLDQLRGQAPAGQQPSGAPPAGGPPSAPQVPQSR